MLSDVLKFSVPIQRKVLTSQGILSMVSSFYDLLGILSPIILPVKGILQELCVTKHGWDDAVGTMGSRPVFELRPEFEVKCCQAT